MKITKNELTACVAHSATFMVQPSRRIASSEIAEQVAAYEALGGVVTVVPFGVGADAKKQAEYNAAIKNHGKRASRLAVRARRGAK